MNFLRHHWFDLAIFLVIVLAIALYAIQPSGMALFLWLSLGSLFMHQIEEWRYPGYFPGMLNTALFSSDIPDRFPLNVNSGMLINVVLGWGGYLLAAILGSPLIKAGNANAVFTA